MPDTVIDIVNPAAGLSHADPPPHQRNVANIGNDAVIICVDDDDSTSNPGSVVPSTKNMVDHLSGQPNEVSSFYGEFHGHWPVLKAETKVCKHDARETRYICKKCTIPLCPSCFRAYHLR